MFKKKGYHSTQRLYFNTIPRSEFYGFVLGYAVGIILQGLFGVESGFWDIFKLVLTAVGFMIGYYIDLKYFQEKDEPFVEPEEIEDEDEAAETAPAAENAAATENAPAAETAPAAENAPAPEAASAAPAAESNPEKQ